MTDTEEPTVTVRGDALVRVEPDEAVLVVTLTALEPAPGDALSDVSERGGALAALLEELGVPRSDRSTTGVTVEEEFDHAPEGRHSLGYRAVSRLSVRLVSAELAGELIARSTRELDARVEGPRWTISLENPARLEAARRASADARRKAEAYAEGVGSRLGRLMELAEAGGPQPRVHAVGLSVRSAPMPVELGEQDVAATVWATFALERS